MALRAVHPGAVWAPWRYVTWVGPRGPVAPLLEAIDLATDRGLAEVVNRGLGRGQAKCVAQDARGISSKCKATHQFRSACNTPAHPLSGNSRSS
jgi:hypothetical protein